jgi:hypothetical protein
LGIARLVPPSEVIGRSAIKQGEAEGRYLRLWVHVRYDTLPCAWLLVRSWEPFTYAPPLPFPSSFFSSSRSVTGQASFPDRGLGVLLDFWADGRDILQLA